MVTATNFIGDRVLDDLVTSLRSSLPAAVSPALNVVVDDSYPDWSKFLAAVAGDANDLYVWIKTRTSPDRHLECQVVDKQKMARIRVALPLSGAQEHTSAARNATLTAVKKSIYEIVETNRTQSGDAYDTYLEDEQEWAPPDSQLFGFEVTFRCQFKYYFV